MIINGKTEEQLNILADTPTITKGSYTSNQTIWGCALRPSRSTYNEGYRSFKCKFAVLGNTKNEITKNASIFIEEIKNCAIEYDNFIYLLDLNSDLITSEQFDIAEAVEIDFNVVDMFESEKSITTNTNKTITINSPKPCYANLEISSNTAVISCIVKVNETEITVKNIKANETIYIGKGKVLAGDKSKIEDVDIWEFPILKPGSNKISVNRSDVNVTVKYNERW